LKLSIITPTLNSEKTIEDCLRSVLRQTYKNIEHILVDGASSDKTIYIARKISPNIKIIVEKDEGIYYALNKGIKNATGDIIGILNSDDFYSSELVFEKIIKVFSEKNVESCYGDLRYVSKYKTSRVIRHWKAGEFNSDNFKYGWMLPHPTFFVKKEVYNRYGFFDLNYHISSDYELMLRFLLKFRITTFYIPEVIVNMRVGGKSNSDIKHFLLKMKEDYLIMRKYSLPAFISLFLKNISKICQFFP